MFGSSVLEIAIGVIFVYLVLSLMCTAINEGISTVINKRGKNLFEGVKNLLNDPKFTGLAQQIYDHGLVDGISKDAVDPKKPNRRPSYLPSKTFSLALMDILNAHGVVSAAHGEALTQAEQADDNYQRLRSPLGAEHDSPEAVNARAAAEQGRAALVDAETNARTSYDLAVQAGGNTPTDIQCEAIAQAKETLDTASAAVKILDARRAAIESARNPKNADLIREASDALEKSLVIGRKIAAGYPNQINNIQAAVNRLPDGHTKESLFVLIDKSKREATDIENEFKQLQQNVENWFNDSMDRVSGWYKRWTQQILIVLAVVIVLLLNADTIMITKRLSTDKDLRAVIVEQAQKADQTKDTDRIEKNIEALSLPLGWSKDPNDSRCFPWLVAGDWEQKLGLTILKLIGLLISIGAVALGAPFWFDMLSKVINIRGAGTPPGEKKKSAG